MKLDDNCSKKNSRHYLTCKALIPTEGNLSHNNGVKHTYDFAETLGAAAITEQRQPCSESKLRIDVRVQMNGKLWLCDVTKRSVQAKSRRDNPGALFANAERDKRTNYAQMAKDEKGVVVPIVLNEFGQLGPAAHQWFDELEKAHASFPNAKQVSSSPSGGDRARDRPGFIMQHFALQSRRAITNAEAQANFAARRESRELAANRALLELAEGTLPEFTQGAGLLLQRKGEHQETKTEAETDEQPRQHDDATAMKDEDSEKDAKLRATAKTSAPASATASLKARTEMATRA